MKINTRGWPFYAFVSEWVVVSFWIFLIVGALALYIAWSLGIVEVK